MRRVSFFRATSLATSFRDFFPGFLPIVLLFSVLLLVPFVALLLLAFGGEAPAWDHLLRTVLPLYVKNSFLLALSVGLGVALVGSVCAYLVTLCDFPGRRVWSLLLILPMTVPAYVAAYAYTDFLEPFGAFSVFASELNWALGSELNWERWNIRTLPTAAILLTATLYPYTYLLVRASFLAQSARMMEVGKVLGCPAWKRFFLISLPLARPAIVAGSALAVLESLADYGLVSFFGVPTLSTGIVNAWTVFADQASAARLSLFLVSTTMLALFIEFLARRKARFADKGSRFGKASFVLSGWKSWGAHLICAVPFLIGFAFPVLLLLRRVHISEELLFSLRFFHLFSNSFLVSILTAGIAVFLGVFFAYHMRVRPGVLGHAAFTMSSLGYGIPGAVLGFGILIPFSFLDNLFNAWFKEAFGMHVGLLLTGSLGALIFGYWVRFQAPACYAIHNGLRKIPKALDDAARSLGQTPASVFQKVLFPLLGPSLISAALLVFIETMKELPITLLLRPFDFDTLAVAAHQRASDERLASAALPSLAIVLSCIPAILWLARGLVFTSSPLGQKSFVPLPDSRPKDESESSPL